MKEKEYDIAAGQRPRVLLMGNGFSRAFGGFSWDSLLDEIKNKTKYPLPSWKYNMPMPLKAAMLSDGQLASQMRELIQPQKKDTSGIHSIHWENFVQCPDALRVFLRSFLGLQFDYILTTNYSYELETALLPKKELSEDSIKKLQDKVEVNRAQTKYLLNTFNHVVDSGMEYLIWHVHGEARKPDSMIVGHNYYGRLQHKIINRVIENDRMSYFQDNFDHHRPVKIGSWVDAFMLGDVYIVGLGLGFSETDLWWLLDQKYLRRSITGKTIYYGKGEPSAPYSPPEKPCPLDSSHPCTFAANYQVHNDCHGLMLESCGVEHRLLNAIDYPKFYEAVYQELKSEFGKS